MDEVWIVCVSAAPFCYELVKGGLGFDLDLGFDESDEVLQRRIVSA